MRLLSMSAMKRGEIWWVEFDPALGSEIRKTRPAVIRSNDAANRNLARVVVVPLTSNVAQVYPGEALVSIDGRSDHGRRQETLENSARGAVPCRHARGRERGGPASGDEAMSC